MTADARTTNGRQQLIDAAIASIQEVGFYRSSTNEIARRANVTWGSLQYHFGTREKLMLAVLEELDRRFVMHIDSASIEGDSTKERIESLYDVLGRRYEDPEWLVRFQILLDLEYDPDISAEAMAEVRVRRRRGVVDPAVVTRNHRAPRRSQRVHRVAARDPRVRDQSAGVAGRANTRHGADARRRDPSIPEPARRRRGRRRLAERPDARGVARQDQVTFRRWNTRELFVDDPP